MADIVVSSKKKINIFDRVIQSVVILVNMTKMNRAIDEHLNVIKKTEGEDKRLREENILREIVFVKYQYDIMQREMYELKLSYSQDILDKINSTEKMDRLELQKTFLEMEYDRVTKAKFKSREDIKFGLLAISSAIDAVKQNIKDEGKSKRYNKVIKLSEEVDTLIQTDEYTEEKYKELFECIDEYVGYINDNYDISKLPTDERELIEYVIETMIKGIESDIDKHMYEYNLMINICKNAYRYFKIIDKIFEKIQEIYDQSLENEVISINDYYKMFSEIYDLKIKTMVNDVHRTIQTEDEYLEYSKLAAADDEEATRKFVLKRALESTKNEKVKGIIQEEIDEKPKVEEVILEDVKIDLEENEDKEDVDNVEDDKPTIKKVVEKAKKTVAKVTKKKTTTKKKKKKKKTTTTRKRATKSKVKESEE